MYRFIFTSFHWFLLLLFISFFYSCAENENSKSDSPVHAENVQDINSVEVNLPDSAGLELVKMNCITCHSLRYIEMQPPFPRKTWEKIVDKMIKTFGAPIPDSSAKAIIDYLMYAKGKS